MATRRPKWHPPPPPTPKILHLPRRSRRPRTTTTTAAAAARPTIPKPTAKSPPLEQTMPMGRLETLFEQERLFTSDRRRTRVEHDHDHDHDHELSSSVQSAPGAGSGEMGEEKWRFQAEILRAECNFLRVERVVARKKEAALRSAVDSLVSGRRKIDGSDNAGVVIKELEGKLEGLRIRRRGCSGGGGKDTEVGWSNFDKKALLLRRKLQEMNVREMMPKKKEKDADVEDCVREIKEIAADTNSIQKKSRSCGGGGGNGCVPSADKNSRLSEVEMLRRKMACISKGMLEKMEEYGTILNSSTTTTCFSATTAASNGSTITRSTRNEAPNNKAAVEKASPDQHQRQECFGRCRAVVGRIVEEVKAETEQWGEMQGMLEQVKEEMDDLRCSRDFWERCAVQSDQKLRTTNSQVMEWRQRARASEQRASELQRQVMELQSEAEELKDELQQRCCSSSVTAAIAATSSNVGKKEKEKEKHVLLCRFMAENASCRGDVPLKPTRQPLREICNLSTTKSARRLEV